MKWVKIERKPQGSDTQLCSIPVFPTFVAGGFEKSIFSNDSSKPNGVY
jgi:hypothetical protein